MKIPFLSFDYQNNTIAAEIKEAFQRVFDSKWYILGKELQEFEANYAKFNCVGHCVGVANGLDALQIALNTLGIGPGDEVIVPSNTYIATWLAISAVGATIIPVEPVSTTFNLDPQGIPGAITSRTKLIMPVHLYGQPCQMEEIMTIAGASGLLVVEDNAQAQGATFNGRLAGSFGQINATSFYPTKNLGAFGDAGALTTDDAGLAAKASVLRNYGSEKKYYNEMIGVNSRLDEMQAAFLSVKLKFLHTWNRQRKELAKKYDELLAGTGDLLLPAVAAGAGHVYHLYVIQTKQRDKLQEYLGRAGIETSVHYPVPPHLQKAYRHRFKPGAFPVAERLAATSLSLPLYPGMPEKDLYAVTESIKAFYG
ncbi:DegT/DnrJ/EryC1/StrS family aminotransferase [Mucilaginibacter sp. BJC16-A38]|uniref:DegT/DnrJ/EryC1/StrS family aminotransferase n=1 Tax=Mucilaginibacter phenanthrenivorans TaxID=1234842 RepID=UPI00215743CF|nr:DegT/DnrJ/EryC1/StrS family aminotransferase [Mucilaginibacter phenanthrenivorans]MCR8560195.1 DegT/DnrJ/EryC1/StrS family aminotransferase [Mucilaginibacter phenanthrenivorans]